MCIGSMVPLCITPSLVQSEGRLDAASVQCSAVQYCVVPE